MQALLQDHVRPAAEWAFRADTVSSAVRSWGSVTRLLNESSTNKRRADERLLLCFCCSIFAISPDMVIFFAEASSFKLPQNASSKLTLVLRPPITTDRLMTVDCT